MKKIITIFVLLVINFVNAQNTNVEAGESNKDKSSGKSNSNEKVGDKFMIDYLSKEQQNIYKKLILENVGGFPIGGYTIFYDKDGTSYKSIKAKRYTIVPGVTIPSLIGGTFDDERNFGIQISPLIGLGFSIRRETITAKSENLDDGFDKNYSISFEPLFLLAKYDVGKNRYVPIIGFSINFFKDYLQLGGGYATRQIPGFINNYYTFIGANLKLESIFPDKQISGEKMEKN